MGKDNLLLGTARGKLGSVVFYRTGGEQRFRTRVRPTNPRTYAQLVQRVVVATAVKAYSPLQSICNHSFQNYNGKAKNMERFMKLNIKWMREMALAQVYSFSPFRLDRDNEGNWSMKDSVEIMLNEYIVSEGDLPEVTPIWTEGPFGDVVATPTINIPSIDPSTNDGVPGTTYQEMCDYLGVEAGTQMTFVMIEDNNYPQGYINKVKVARIILAPASGDMSEPLFKPGSGTNRFTVNNPNKENYGEIYFGSNGYNNGIVQLTFGVANTPTGNQDMAGAAVILSNYTNTEWRRSNASIVMRDKAQQYNQKLSSAIASYFYVDKSSEYLNQSNNAEDIAFDSSLQERYGIDTTNDDAVEEIETIIEEEAETKKRRK